MVPHGGCPSQSPRGTRRASRGPSLSRKSLPLPTACPRRGHSATPTTHCSTTPPGALSALSALAPAAALIVDVRHYLNSISGWGGGAAVHAGTEATASATADTSTASLVQVGRGGHSHGQQRACAAWRHPIRGHLQSLRPSLSCLSCRGRGLCVCACDPPTPRVGRPSR